MDVINHFLFLLFLGCLPVAQDNHGRLVAADVNTPSGFQCRLPSLV